LSFFADLPNTFTIAILIASFLGSFITASMGIGGGIALLSILASLLPPAAIIPVHGIVQVGSNAGRWIMFSKYFNASALLPFAGGAVAGAILGGIVVVELDPSVLQLCLGFFILWSIFGKPPAILSKSASLNGAISSILTMFVGGTGPFVATYIKSLNLERMRHTATHAAFMTIQHSLKTIVFGFLGFTFVAWLPLIVAMILTGLVGTFVGKKVLIKMNDQLFKKLLNAVLVILAVRLIVVGAIGLRS